MLAALLLLLVSSACAVPQTPPSPCMTVQSGNLSPNGASGKQRCIAGGTNDDICLPSGNFGLFNGVLAFDPTNLATNFDISLQACASGPTVPGAVSAGTLLAPTGKCLSAKNATATQGPTVVAVDCAVADAQSDMTWALHQGFLFWAGPTSDACSTGLYGYKATSPSGNPTAVQKAPINLGCSADSTVFGFSVVQ